MPIQKRRKLSGRVTLAIIVGVVLFLLPFYYVGRMDLARPSLFAATAIGCAMATRWKLRSRRWFWVGMAIVAALHVYLILHFQLDVEWLNQFVVATYTLIDFGLILVFIWVLEVIRRTPEEAESRRRKSLP